MQLFLSKARGLTINEDNPDRRPLPAKPLAIAISTAMAFVSMLLCNLVNQHTPFLSDSPLALESSILIGSFGATAVLLYHAIESPMAQPPNLLGGHVLSALIGVSVSKLFNLEALSPFKSTFAGPLAVSLSILGMLLTNMLHPPGGATALIAVISGEEVQNLGFLFVIRPVLSGVLCLLVCAVLFNNLDPARRYPLFWFPRYTKNSK